MARPLLIALLLVAGLAVPGSALARKNAWQLVSLSGTYAYHAANTAPRSCGPDVTSDSGDVLSRDWTESFHADRFPSYQYAAKYFPVFSGPQTNGPGQKAHLIRQGTIGETYRTFNAGIDADGNPTCTQQDQSCSQAQSIRTSRFLFGVGHRGRGFHGPLVTSWRIDFAANIGDCTPRNVDDLAGGLLPPNSAGIPDVFSKRASKRSFARRRATFTIHGTAPVRGASGFSASISYSVRATVKKVVIRDGCADLHPQHLFVCTNP
jgi:hypothetical protein